MYLANFPSPKIIIHSLQEISRKKFLFFFFFLIVYGKKRLISFHFSFRGLWWWWKVFKVLFRDAHCNDMIRILCLCLGQTLFIIMINLIDWKVIETHQTSSLFRMKIIHLHSIIFIIIWHEWWWKNQ